MNCCDKQRITSSLRTVGHSSGVLHVPFEPPAYGTGLIEDTIIWADYWKRFVVVRGKHPSESLVLNPALIFKMDSRKFQVKVVADSRGRLLKRELQRLNDNSFYFHTRFRKGAKLVDLWEIVEEELLKGQTDLLIIYGGICDITDIVHNRFGVREFWPPTDISGRFNDIKSLMSGLANNYNLLNPKTKLCFMPEAGLDLAMVNRLTYVDENIKVIQAKLESELEELRCHTKHINDSMNMTTPWTLKVTHSRRKNKWWPAYSRSVDGLHPTLYQANYLARVLKEFSKSALISKR